MAEPIYITSRSNPFVVKIASLSEKKYRDAARLFTADGLKLFREAAACGMRFAAVVVREDKQDAFLPEIAGRLANTPVYVLSDSAFSKITDEKAPQGIISVLQYADFLHKTVESAEDAARELPAGVSAIALESVRDPGNLGTVLRSAAAFGTDAVLLSEDCADIYNPRTVRAAMGALFTRKVIRVSRLDTAVSAIVRAGRRVYATTLSDTAESLQDLTCRADDIFVIGNEGHGLSRQVVDACSGAVFIEMLTGPGIESLNAAVAASVIMYERKRCQ